MFLFTFFFFLLNYWHGLLLKIKLQDLLFVDSLISHSHVGTTILIKYKQDKKRLPSAPSPDGHLRRPILAPTSEERTGGGGSRQGKLLAFEN